MIPHTIRQQLTDKEITGIDMRIFGELILSETVTLSQTVNTELLEPISRWIEDSDFVKRHAVVLEKDAPTWAERKYEQRMIQRMNQIEITRTEKYEYADKILAMLKILEEKTNTEIEKAYIKEIKEKMNYEENRAFIENAGKGDLYSIYQSIFHKVRWKTKKQEEAFRRTLAKDIIPKNSPTYNTEKNPKPHTDPTAITSILAAFSPAQQQRMETEREFNQSLDMYISNLLPWRLILTDTLTKHGNEPTTFRKLDQIIRHNKKADAIAKFQHLLQMECDGDITLDQSEPDQNQGSEPNQGSDITIIPRSTREMTACATESKIIIKDRSGEQIERDWHTLSDAQRHKVIADAIERRILCKTAHQQYA